MHARAVCAAVARSIRIQLQINPFVDTIYFNLNPDGWLTVVNKGPSYSLPVLGKYEGGYAYIAARAVENYVLRYDKKNDRPWIIFHYRIDGQVHNVNWFPPKENAVYIADMLRNEKPVYWVPEGQWLTTSGEVVGEEET